MGALTLGMILASTAEKFQLKQVDSKLKMKVSVKYIRFRKPGLPVHAPGALYKFGNYSKRRPDLMRFKPEVSLAIISLFQGNLPKKPT